VGRTVMFRGAHHAHVCVVHVLERTTTKIKYKCKTSQTRHPWDQTGVEPSGSRVVSVLRHQNTYGGAGGVRRYSSYSFTTAALDWGEWLVSRPGRALAPGKGPPVPIVQEAGWAPEPVWTQRLEEKSSAPAGNRAPIARSSSP
jgi:hypothetical protein